MRTFRPIELTPDEERRFWSCVEKGSDHWRWIGLMNKRSRMGLFQSYEKTEEGGWTTRQLMAHRVAWVLAHGRPIAPGLMVVHRCALFSCVKPGHLIEGTIVEQAAAKRARGTLSAGEKHGRAKLRRSDVVKIRRLAAEGWSMARLGRQFGVTTTMAHLIAQGRAWRDPDYAKRTFAGRRATGEAHPRALFRRAQVEAMRRRLARGAATVAEIAREQGVAYTTIAKIATRRTWRS